MYKIAYFVSLTSTTNLVVKPKDQEENDQMQHIMSKKGIWEISVGYIREREIRELRWFKA
jgi:hypothetical protein